MKTKLALIDINKNEVSRIPKSIITAVKSSGHQVIHIENINELMKGLKDVDYIVGYSIPYTYIKRNKNLKEVFLLSSQVPESFLNKDFKVESIKGLNAKTVANYAFKWIEELTLPNFKIGVIGLGSIGKEVVTLCSDKKLNVMSISRNSEADYRYDQYTEFLNQVDIICICTTLNQETKELFTKERFFYHLKKDCRIINIARGELFHETDLVSFLSESKKAVYYTDVTYPEPYPEDGALRKLSNIKITPHIAGFSDEVWAAVEKKLTEALSQWGE